MFYVASVEQCVLASVVTRRREVYFQVRQCGCESLYIGLSVCVEQSVLERI